MGAAIGLRADFDGAALRRLARKTTQANQSRRLLALAEIYDGGSRSGSARIGGVGISVCARLGRSVQCSRAGWADGWQGARQATQAQ